MECRAAIGCLASEAGGLKPPQSSDDPAVIGTGLKTDAQPGVTQTFKAAAIPQKYAVVPLQGFPQGNQ